MGFIFIVLSVLGFFYTQISYADLIIEPRVQLGSAGFLSGTTTILLISIVVGIVLLLLIAYYMRRK